MEYQKIINLWDHTPNQPIRFRTKNRFEKSDDSHGSYNTNNQIKFKTLVLRSSLCDYSDRYILVSETITISAAGNDDTTRRLEEINKWVIFKKCALFTDCITEINNTQIDKSKFIDF